MTQRPATPPLQLWGGVEGSVVQVAGAWRDQMRETGHQHRADDLDRIAALGIRTLRYPVLWERCTPGPACCGWEWHDARMGRLRTLGVAPIVGLVHHGSGPPGRSPLDPDWAEGLAEHAGLAAARYPWVQDWTPVNEPLTTARFAALYGFWHPHPKPDTATIPPSSNQDGGDDTTGCMKPHKGPSDDGQRGSRA